jgi:hypothetical protein
VDAIFPVGRIPSHRRVVPYPSVLPVRDRFKREEVVRRFQFSDRGGDDSDIHGRTVQVLPAFAATASVGNCRRQRPAERLNIAQVDLSAAVNTSLPSTDRAVSRVSELGIRRFLPSNAQWFHRFRDRW